MMPSLSKKKNARLNWLLIFIFSSVCIEANNLEIDLPPLSDAEAGAIVAASEKAKEQAKDAREAELGAADILETAVADLGAKKVIFNRVEKPSTAPEIHSEPTATEQLSEPVLTEAEILEALKNIKPVVNITLSGEVSEDGISELWWEHQQVHYRIFTNANFLYFTGIGDFEDDQNRYSMFTLISPQFGEPSSDAWQPNPADFSPDALEYYIMEWGDSDEPDAAAFGAIEAMLAHYAANADTMKIRYENQQKLQAAAKAYDEQNPPEVRDVIINFRPLK